jgi:hypothetical protein
MFKHGFSFGMRHRPNRPIIGKRTFGDKRSVTQIRWDRHAMLVSNDVRCQCRCAAVHPNGNLDDPRAVFRPSKNRYRSLCVTLTLGCSIVGCAAYNANLGPVVALAIWMQVVGFALHWFQLYGTQVGPVDVASSALGSLIYFIILCKVSVVGVGGHILFLLIALWNYFANLQEHPYSQRQMHMHWFQHLTGTLTNLNFIYWVGTSGTAVHVQDLLPSTVR